MVEKSHTAGWWPELYQPFKALGDKVAGWFAPASEASSDADAYEIAMELPGVEEKDIDLSVHGNTLTVSGEKRSEREERGKSYYFSERSFGAFQRSFRLPADAHPERISATIRQGVLTITVPKTAGATEGARKIEVRQG